MFKLTIINYYGNKVVFTFDDKKGNVIGFDSNVPIFSKELFLNNTVFEIIKEKTGLVLEPKNVEIEFNKGEEDFNNFIKQEKRKNLNGEVRFIGFSYSLDEYLSHGIYDNYDVKVTLEDANNKQYVFDLDSTFVIKGTNPNGYKSTLFTLISAAAKYGNLVIDKNVISATESN